MKGRPAWKALRDRKDLIVTFKLRVLCQLQRVGV